MSLYYNTGAPTPTTRNTINEVAVTFGIRDFLLNLNLLPQYPQIQTSINGSPRIGEPVLDTTVGTGNVLVPIGLPLETNGIIWKDLNVIYNTFQNDPSLSNILEDIDYIPALTNPEFGSAIWPTNSQYPIGANSQIDQYGLKAKTEIAEYRKDNVIKNLYLDSDRQIDVADFITMFPLDISQQLGNYIDVFGGLNEGGTTGEQAINVIGSVLNGQGVGLGAGGSVIPNFDIRASLAGRVLGAAGFINDTRLGNIGAQQLALALANNAAFNVQQELLGSLNIKENIYSLIKDGEFAGFRPNYKITIASSLGGQILTGAAQILGFQIPRSYLGDEGSIFQTENGDAANIDRANAMILNTGKGQVKSLISNVIASSNVNTTNNPFRSGYTPAYKNNKGDDAVPSGNTKIYAYSTEGNVDKILGNASFGVDDVIPEINYNREALTIKSGFESPDDKFVSTAGFINSGYNNKNVNSIGFSWTSQNGEAVNKVKNLSSLPIPGITPVPTEITGDKKSLLVKTQKLFNSKGMKSLVTVKGEMNQNSSQINTSNNSGISKGSAVLTPANFDLERGVVAKSTPDADTTFCRSWTTLKRYDSIANLIRNKPLYSDPDVAYRFQTKGSVLDGPFVKIAPYSNDLETDPKKFMFSIENLAWKDKFEELPPCEQGPGDLISGDRGRIMWFPPYDIQFSENNTVNWEENNFIGRGEPIYTYNNTKRSGQLSFKIIVDHPSYYNAFNAKRNTGTGGPDDNYIASFFAGCVDVNKRWADKLMSTQNIDKIESRPVKEEQVRQSPSDPTPPKTCYVYFPNDVKTYVNEYEDGFLSGTTTPIDYINNPNGEGQGLGYYPADVTKKDVKGITTAWVDNYDYGLNAGRLGNELEVNGVKYNGYNDPNWQVAMVEFLKSYPWAVVKVKGYASAQGLPDSNKKLADLRADGIIATLKQTWGSQLGLNQTQLEKRFKKIGSVVSPARAGCIIQSKSNPNPPTDTEDCKLDRKVEISIEFSNELKAEFEKSLAPLPPKITYDNVRLTNEIKNKFYTECDYFERLGGGYDEEGNFVATDTKFVFDSIREKIRYFHPAFHSTTPEGLNSRLTFLLQCTRQGPTLEDQGANNLAFGRPPVCILRIGDFYNTKIVIDNINIGYEPLVWDLNPEGVGVQPMIANVDISFNFLGGSSLMGPINKLQNALSFNYFANTHVYDPRADYISKDRPIIEEEFSEGTVGSEEGITVGLRRVPAPESPTGYYINDGKSYTKYIDSINKSNKEEFISTTDQPLDQIKDEQAVNSGLENTTQPETSTTTGATTENDVKVIAGFNIDSYLKIDENETEDIDISFKFQFQPVNNTNVNLTKSYVGKFYIENSTTREKKLIDTINVRPNNDSNVILSNASSSSEVIVSLDNNVKMIFNLQVNIQNNESLVSFIKSTYATSGSNLEIEWETGAVVNYGWNKTIAKASFN